jgi:uncharacterized membrane protein (UPF0127 family)
MIRTPSVLFALALALAGCARSDPGQDSVVQNGFAPVTLTGVSGAKTLNVELARTPAQQERGLMFRTDLKPGQGMLFYPYPAAGGPPRPANFWMKNTPTSLDIIFIRADGTIARIAENTVPYSEEQVSSGEAVAAVLELVGGQAAVLGLSEGDKVTLPKLSS